MALLSREQLEELLIRGIKNGKVFDSMACIHAAQNGHIEVLKYARSERCGYNEHTLPWMRTVATKAGQTEVLRWLDEEWIDIHDAPPIDDEDGL